MPDKTTVAGELPILAWLILHGQPHDPVRNVYLHNAIADYRERDCGATSQPLVLQSDATAALAQKDGEIAALRVALLQVTNILDRMGDMPDEFISPGVWRDLKCEREIEFARAALGSQA